MDGLPTLQSPHARSRRRGWLAALLPVLLVATGCGSQGGIKQAFGKGLQAVGLGDAKAQAHEVPLRLYAGDNLNAGDGKRALSLVVRVYQLRNLERFEAAQFDVFLDQQREHDVLGDDLLGVTEILLAPGKCSNEFRPQGDISGWWRCSANRPAAAGALCSMPAKRPAMASRSACMPAR